MVMVISPSAFARCSCEGKGPRHWVAGMRWPEMWF